MLSGLTTSSSRITGLERGVLLSVGGQSLVQFVFGNHPRHALVVWGVVLAGTQYQCAGNEVVGTGTSLDDMFLVETVVGDLYPCTVRVDAEYQLLVYRISHGPMFQKKSIRTSARSFLYLKCPLLECSFRSRQRSPYIISSES